MIKSYRLKIYANKSKRKQLNRLLAYWQDQVNRKIEIFWKFDLVRGSYCPSGYALGGRIKRDSSIKAWQIVKGTRFAKQEKPHFRGNEIDLNQASAYIIPEFRTKEFDIWFNVICLTKQKRLKIPCKRTKRFNDAVGVGKLKKSFKILKIGNKYFVQLFVEFKEKVKQNKKLLGIDVGINNAIATSDGRLLGKELKDLRKRTKHRKYVRKITPSKQGLNHYANRLVRYYRDTDFVVEDLLFKGKRKRTRSFRRQHNRWAYNHLANHLRQIGRLEGFGLIKVEPAFSSVICPKCGFSDKANRQESLFRCGQCGYRENADVVGAINLVERVARGPSVSLTRSEE